MSKRKPGRGVDAKGGSKKDAPHIRLYHWMRDSPAWKATTPEERAIYVELKGLFNGGNNGRIDLSCREAAERTNVHRNTAAKAFKGLEDKGFIKRAGGGALGFDGRGIASRWVLTEYGHGGQLPTKDFMRWQPGKNQNPVPVKGQSVPVEGQGNVQKGDFGARKDRNAA